MINSSKDGDDRARKIRARPMHIGWGGVNFDPPWLFFFHNIKDNCEFWSLGQIMFSWQSKIKGPLSFDMHGQIYKKNQNCPIRTLLFKMSILKMALKNN